MVEEEEGEAEEVEDLEAETTNVIRAARVGTLPVTAEGVEEGGTEVEAGEGVEGEEDTAVAGAAAGRLS